MAKKFSMTAEQLADFRRNGFAGPFDLYDKEEIEKEYRDLRARIFDRSNAAYDLPADSRLAGYDRHLDIDFLSRHITRREVIDKLEDILGPDLICWRSEMFPKYPGDEGTDWHQADTFEHASGAPQVVWPMNSDFGGAVTVWTAITDADEENGCLRFIPGTHEEMFYDETKQMNYNPDLINKLEKDGAKSGFFGYDYRNLQKDPDWKPKEEDAVSMVMKKGQFVIFWSTTMHASFPNASKNRTRLGFTARYVPASVHIYPDTEQVEEYGSTLSLEKYGVVVVSGKDKSEHNKVITKNLRGQEFEVL